MGEIHSELYFTLDYVCVNDDFHGCKRSLGIESSLCPFLGFKLTLCQISSKSVQWFSVESVTDGQTGLLFYTLFSHLSLMNFIGMHFMMMNLY